MRRVSPPAVRAQGFVRRFEGWSEEESAPLLRFLFERAERHLLTHEWTVGDLLMWCTANHFPNATLALCLRL